METPADKKMTPRGVCVALGVISTKSMDECFVLYVCSTLQLCPLCLSTHSQMRRTSRPFHPHPANRSDLLPEIWDTGV